MTASDILIATGGRAFVPDIPGAELGITSDEALNLSELPKKVIIIGSGYIAVEFAGIFSGLGVEVGLVYRQQLPLRGFDDDIRTTVSSNLEARGIQQVPNCQPVNLSKNSSGSLSLKTTLGTLEADAVVFATGRVPNTTRPSLGLENVGVVELSVLGAKNVRKFKGRISCKVHTRGARAAPRADRAAQGARP